MKYFSMFSGIGGFELGIQRANMDIEQPNTKSKQTKSKILEGEFGTTMEEEYSVLLADQWRRRSICVGYSEIDKYAIKVYERHFNGHRNYGNATTINPDELPDFDLLVGGFPCQAFSIAGKRKGFDDTRGTLFFDIARILENKRPRHLVLENVKGLLSHDGGKTFQTILGVLSDLGYRVEWQILNSKDFGVPQNRERIFIIGHLRGECGRKVFPIRQSVKLSKKSVRQGQVKNIYSTAITTNYRKGVHSGGETYALEDLRIRRLTPKECERLQGFPDDWTAGESDTQRYKMCGNAVTVNVIEAIMKEICV